MVREIRHCDNGCHACSKISSGKMGYSLPTIPSEVQENLTASDVAGPLQLSMTDRAKRKRVLWDECLSALPSFAEKIEKLRAANVDGTPPNDLDKCYDQRELASASSWYRSR